MYRKENGDWLLFGPPYGGCLSPFFARPLRHRHKLGYTKGMKTAISIPASLFATAERVVQRLGISRSQLFQRAVKAFLRGHQHDRVTEALNKVYASDSEAGKLDPMLEHLQAASIPKEEW